MGRTLLGPGFDQRGGQGLGGVGQGQGQGLGQGLGGGVGDDNASMASDKGGNSSIYSLHMYWDEEKARLNAINQSREDQAKQQILQEQQQQERAKRLKNWQVRLCDGYNMPSARR